MFIVLFDNKLHKKNIDFIPKNTDHLDHNHWSNIYFLINRGNHLCFENIFYIDVMWERKNYHSHISKNKFINSIANIYNIKLQSRLFSINFYRYTPRDMVYYDTYDDFFMGKLQDDTGALFVDGRHIVIDKKSRI